MIYATQYSDLNSSAQDAHAAKMAYEAAKETWHKKAVLHQTQVLAFTLQKKIIEHNADEIMYLGFLSQQANINNNQLLEPGHYFDYKCVAKKIDYTGIDLKSVSYHTPYKSQMENFSKYEKRLNTLYPDFSDLLDELNATVNGYHSLAPELMNPRQAFLNNLRGKPLTSDIKVIMEALMSPEDYKNWSNVYDIVSQKNMLNNAVGQATSTTPTQAPKNGSNFSQKNKI